MRGLSASASTTATPVVVATLSFLLLAFLVISACAVSKALVFALIPLLGFPDHPTNIALEPTEHLTLIVVSTHVTSSV
jgi:hypothetical protein